MTPSVRVIGRIELAEKACAALRAAGVETRLHLGGPSAAQTSAPAHGTDVDLVVVSSAWDVGTCAAMKLHRAMRPVILAADRRHESRLRRITARGLGPDAWIAMPASGDEILAAVQRAAAAQPERGWERRLDAALVVGSPFLLIGSLNGALVAPAAVVIGAVMLMRAYRSWYRAANAVGGALLLAGG